MTAEHFRLLLVIIGAVSAAIAVWSIRNARYAAVWRATLDFIHAYNDAPRVNRGMAVVRDAIANIPLEKGPSGTTSCS